MDRLMPMKTKKATYSIPTIRKMLGLGKTESYWLIEHRKFETVVLHGHVRVTKASFEEWYENHKNERNYYRAVWFLEVETNEGKIK